MFTAEKLKKKKKSYGKCLIAVIIITGLAIIIAKKIDFSWIIVVVKYVLS